MTGIPVFLPKMRKNRENWVAFPPRLWYSKAKERESPGPVSCYAGREDESIRREIR